MNPGRPTEARPISPSPRSLLGAPSTNACGLAEARPQAGFSARPVGVLDSGVGGLSVLREIRRQLPAESLLYVADQAHIPYGPRSLDQIRGLSVAITRFLLDRGAKAIVVACNTASAAALHHLRDTFSQVPFVGMEPAIKPAAQLSQSRVVGVIATPATFQGELFASLTERFAQGVTILEQVCPGLVEQVEKGALGSPDTVQMLRMHLAPLLHAGMDTLVLGCTHYPFLVPAMRQVVGRAVQIIDPSPAVARQTGRVLAQWGWLSQHPAPGEFLCFTSGDPERFEELAAELVDDLGPVAALRWRTDGATVALEALGP